MAACIMVINDTQEILELFRDLLTEEGYEVSLYSYAVHDMRVVEETAPDLIIIDYLIGDESTGWQMLQKLKMTRATAAIPIIVCTAALNQVKEIEGWLTQKGITVVLKPFDVDDLLDAVRRVLALAPDPAPRAKE